MISEEEKTAVVEACSDILLYCNVKEKNIWKTLKKKVATASEKELGEYLMELYRRKDFWHLFSMLGNQLYWNHIIDNLADVRDLPFGDSTIFTVADKPDDWREGLFLAEKELKKNIDNK